MSFAEQIQADNTPNRLAVVPSEVSERQGYVHSVQAAVLEISSDRMKDVIIRRLLDRSTPEEIGRELALDPLMVCDMLHTFKSNVIYFAQHPEQLKKSSSGHNSL